MDNSPKTKCVLRDRSSFYWPGCEDQITKLFLAAMSVKLTEPVITVNSSRTGYGTLISIRVHRHFKVPQP